jgi:outer membrane lipopolysaccharide assembly protein LptE/RlpB
MKRRGGLSICAVGIALLMGACGNAQREATEAAINAAQTAINTAQGTTDKFVPEQMTAAREVLQTAKDDYGTALSGAREATQKTKEAVAAAAVKKEEWAKTWESLNTTAPKTLSEIQIKMDVFKKYGRLPKGVEAEQMESASAQFDQLKQNWADAKTEYKNGNLAEAMKKASAFKDELQKVKDQLTAPPLG